MWILIKGIDRSIDERELERLVAQTLRPGWLPIPSRHNSALKRCEILKITNVRNEETEHYGLVRLEPPQKAQQVLDRLNDAPVNGRHLSAHQFHRRIARRDRRQPFSEWRGPPQQDRRKRDRRRPDLYIRIPHAPQLERVLGVHHQF